MNIFFDQFNCAGSGREACSNMYPYFLSRNNFVFMPKINPKW